MSLVLVPQEMLQVLLLPLVLLELLLLLLPLEPVELLLELVVPPMGPPVGRRASAQAASLLQQMVR